MARPAESAEATSVWEKAVGLYPGYASYPGWAPDRKIRVLVLEARKPPSDGQGD